MEQEERDRLIMENQALVTYIVAKYNHYAFDDLFSCGQIGLINAANHFDPSRGVKFGTYAAICIRNEVAMFLRKENREAQHLRLDKIIQTRDDNEKNDLYYFLENGDDPLTLHIENTEDLTMLKDALQCLTEREREIISLYYQLNGTPPILCEEIGKMYNISQSYVSRIIIKARQKMKDYITGGDS